MCLLCLAWAGTRQALPASPSGEGRSQYECTAPHCSGVGRGGWSRDSFLGQMQDGLGPESGDHPCPQPQCDQASPLCLGLGAVPRTPQIFGAKPGFPGEDDLNWG